MKMKRNSKQMLLGAAILAVAMTSPNRLMTAESVIVREVKKLMEPSLSAQAYFGVSPRVSGDILVVSAPVANNQRGMLFIYQRDRGGLNNWGLIRQLSLATLQDGDRFGNESAIFGNLLAVSTHPNYGSEFGSGTVYLIERHAFYADSWSEIGNVQAPVPWSTYGNRFGYALDLDGDILAVGAPYDDERISEAGACYIFGRDEGGPNQWGLVTKLMPADLEVGGRFGASVTLDGDRLAVGAPRTDNGVGACYLFERDAGGPDNWGLVKKISPAGSISGDHLGYNSLQGDILVVGSPGDSELEEDVGAAYVFYRNRGGPDQWGFVKKLLPGNELPGAVFGVELAVEGDLIAINAGGLDAQDVPGAVYLFQKDLGGPDNWGILQRVQPHDPTWDKKFGWWNGIDLANGFLAVAATKDDEAGANLGAAYVFQVLRPPILTIACQGNETELCWPHTPGTCLAVEHSPSLSPSAQWSLLPHGRMNPCRIPLDGAARFFRLVEVPHLQIIYWADVPAIREGATTTLAVQAIGLEPLTYEWRHNGELLNGANASTLIIANAQYSDRGEYTVTVSDACGSITTEPRLLTVLMPPTIVEHPQSQTARVGDTVTFSVTVSDTATLPVDYRWRLGHTTLETQSLDEFTSTYTIENVQLEHAGSYTVVVTNIAYSTPGFISNPAILEVLEE